MYKSLVIFTAVFVMVIAAIVSAKEGIIVDEQEAQFSKMRPDVGSVFMRIKNDTKTDDNLINAEVDIKGAYTELHDVKEGSMVKINRIPVPAGATVRLKRGGLHIMLFNLPIELKEGDEFTLTLIFEKSGRKDLKVRFSKAGHHMHNH